MEEEIKQEYEIKTSAIMRKEEEENTIAKLGSKVKLGFSKWFK